MPFQPMLAATRAPLPLPGEWVLEPKFDGWRTIVAIDDGVRVWTRTGHELTDRLPELAPLADALDGHAIVLDGELVFAQGRASDFYGLLPRVAARTRRVPLAFVAFDVLALDGEPVIDRPYSNRRALLKGLALNGSAWCTTPQLRGRVVDVLTACRDHDCPVWFGYANAERQIGGPRRAPSGPSAQYNELFLWAVVERRITIDDEKGTVPDSVRGEVAVLCGHPRTPLSEHVLAVSLKTAAQPVLFRCFDEGGQGARCRLHSLRPADTPSMMTTRARLIVTQSARRCCAQSYLWKQASSPAASGSMTCPRSLGHHASGSSHEAKSSVCTTGASPACRESRAANVLFPAPPGPSTATSRTGGGRDSTSATRASNVIVSTESPLPCPSSLDT